MQLSMTQNIYIYIGLISIVLIVLISILIILLHKQITRCRSFVIVLLFDLIGLVLLMSLATMLPHTTSLSSGEYSTPAQLQAVFHGHTLSANDLTNGLAWSPNGKSIVSSGGIGDIQSWNADTGQHILTFQKGNQKFANLYHLAWSPNGRWIAAAGYGSRISVWDAQSGKLLAHRDCQCISISELAWSPDSFALATINNDNVFQIWDLSSNRQLLELSAIKHEKILSVASWMTNTLYLMSSNENGVYHIWDILGKKQIFEYKTSKDLKVSLTMSPDLKYIAVADNHQLIQIWNLAQQKRLLTYPTLLDDPYHAPSVFWSPNSNYIMTSSTSQSTIAVIWDAHSGSDLFSYSVPDSGADFSRWSPDGTRIASNDWNNSIEVWRVPTTIESQQPLSLSTLLRSPLIVFLGLFLISFCAFFFMLLVFLMEPNGTWKIGLVAVLGIICIAGLVAWQVLGNQRISGALPIASNMKQGTTIYALRGSVVAWSPDRTHLATGLGDGSVYIWSADSSRRVMVQHSYNSSVTALTWSPGGDFLAAGYASGWVQIWDTDTGASILTYKKHTHSISSLVWSPDGSRIASLSLPDKTILVWQAPHISPSFLFQPGKRSLLFNSVYIFFYVLLAVIAVYSFRRSDKKPMRRTVPLAFAGAFVLPGFLLLCFQCISFLSVSSMRAPGTTLLHHTGNVLSWSPDSHFIASTNVDGLVHIWNTNDSREVLRYPSHTLEVKSLAWSPDQRYIASGNSDGSVQVWDATSGHTRFTYTDLEGAILSIAWSPDGKRLAGSGNTIQVWDAFSGKHLYMYLEQPTKVTMLAWSPDGSRIASSGGGVTQVWQAQTSAVPSSQLPVSYKYAAALIALSPDGTHFATVQRQSDTVRIWQTADRDRTLTYRRAGGTVMSVAWSHDSQRVATSYVDGTLLIWSPRTGQTYAQYRYQSPLLQLAWSQDDSRIISTSGTDTTYTLLAIESGTGDLLFIENLGKGLSMMALSPDGKHLAVISDTIQLWDVQTHQMLWSIANDQLEARTLAWSPDSKELVMAGGENGLIEQVDASTGTILRTFPHYTDVVEGGFFCVSWSHDGKYIITSDYSFSLQLWNAATGQYIRSFYGLSDIATTISWSPDNRSLVLETHLSMFVYLWKLPF